MKTEIIVPAVLFLILVAAWSYAKTPSFHWKTYGFKDGQFSLESPYTFKQAGRPGESLILLPPPKVTRLIAVVYAKAHGAGPMDLAEMKKAMIAVFAQQGCYDFRIMDQTTVCGYQPALLSQGSYKDPTEMDREIRMLVVKKDDRWWTLAVNFEPGDKEQEKNAERMIKSFKVTP